MQQWRSSARIELSVLQLYDMPLNHLASIDIYLRIWIYNPRSMFQIYIQMKENTQGKRSPIGLQKPAEEKLYER